MTDEIQQVQRLSLACALVVALVVAGCGGAPGGSTDAASAGGTTGGAMGAADGPAGGGPLEGGAMDSPAVIDASGGAMDSPAVIDASGGAGGAAGTGGAGGASGAGGAGGQRASLPSFVAASAGVFASQQRALEIASPAGIQEGDLVLALVDAWEGDGARTLSAPAGWTLLGGFPLHNRSTEHPPFVIPATENHGTWIYTRIAAAAEPRAHSFSFSSASTARGVLLAYRGADPAAPIHDKTAFAFHGTGETNGRGLGTTSLARALQVTLIATGRTDHPTYTVVRAGASDVERFNSGEQPNGLNLVAYDAPVRSGIYAAPSIANRKSPSGLSDGFLFTFATLVLKPR